jgi:hypothetical protein
MAMKREVKALLPILVGLMVILAGDTYISAQNAPKKKEQDQPKQDQPKQDQDKPAKQPATQQEQKKLATGLVEDWLNDFEDCEDWRAVATSPLGDTKIRKIPGKPIEVKENGDVVQIEMNLTDENGVTHKNDNVLGVKTYYVERGTDRVEVFPPNEYIIRGKAKEIKVWALGRKFRHTLYVKLRDYRGNTHKLKLGRLDFWGWKELTVVVPGWLPQSPQYAMLDKNLHFVSFFVESDMYEIPGTFYTYLDNLRVITDLSEFTGDPQIRDNW